MQLSDTVLAEFKQPPTTELEPILPAEQQLMASDEKKGDDPLHLPAPPTHESAVLDAEVRRPEKNSENIVDKLRLAFRKAFQSGDASQNKAAKLKSE